MSVKEITTPMKILNEGYRAMTCDGTTECKGCHSFGEDLCSSHAGRQTLASRFGSQVSSFEPEIGVNVCLWRSEESPIPACVASAVIIDSQAEVAILTHPDHTRKGLATTASMLLAQQLKETGASLIVANIDPYNAPVRSLLNSLGFEPRGTLHGFLQLSLSLK